LDTGQGPQDQGVRNRRKNPRVRARGLAVHVSANGRRHPCVVENISIGGLFIRTDSLLELGSEVRVDLVRPGWKKMLQLGARIVSRTDAGGSHAKLTPGMGVQFFGVRGEQRDKLELLLHELGLPPEAGQPIPVVPTLDELDATQIDPLDPNPPLPGLSLHEPPEPLEPLDPQPPPRPFVSLAARAARSRQQEPLDPHVPPVMYPATPQQQHAGAPEVDPLDPDLPAPLPELPLDAIIAAPERPRDEIVPPHPPPLPSDAARLMLQIQGLLMELSNAHDLIRERDHELDRLREEVNSLRGDKS